MRPYCYAGVCTNVRHILLLDGVRIGSILLQARLHRPVERRRGSKVLQLSRTSGMG